MKLRFTWVMMLCFLIPHICHSQTITLEDFLQRIQETHPFFESESLSVEIESTAQEGLLGGEDWNINGTTFFTHQKLLASSSFSGIVILSRFR